MNGTTERNGPPAVEPAIRAVPMPADANQNGDIFGGWVLSQMDIAGGLVAARQAQGRVATVAITAMTFHQPVLVGDEVSFYGVVTKVGRTSIAVKIESWARRLTGEHTKVTEGLFTYVAIGTDRRPRPVPQIR
ncbi:MAG TPA: acyl-CoA thioesterase [Stellaceae bacterium]|jgi:acyl-CoA thioesterase YciA|nr:acyl-CoA thioesterase [Stellaceae bacterium]